ncbi:hypothetical protein BDU57DRAFT_553839 [Ampelomyces quisqualis]|uniref:DUF1857-domain-containing protein n=1 Tax=Ampelomyces quisqualis TaxID=50730 RepID=A0A6A5R280_AMPQU|nr:hypothetical protein BDU57DRAFT_553839 [Ampelomyces quisqualis]
MQKLFYAHTSPLPPPLTHAHLWAGLQRKMRSPQDFVPAITACTVERDDAGRGIVTREVSLAGRVVREECRTYGRSWVEFVRGDGSVVRNVISGGEGEGQVYLTFEFEVEGEGEEEMRKLKEMARMAVEKTIETVGVMVRDGRIVA